jgi:CHAT domain-containing protein
MSAGDAAGAVAQLDAALAGARSGSRDPWLFAKAGYMLVKLGRGREAIEQLGQSLQLSGGDPQVELVANAWLARAHAMLENYGPAETHYRAAMRAADRLSGADMLSSATLDVMVADVMRMRGECSKAEVNYQRIAGFSDPHQTLGSNRDLAHEVWTHAETGRARCDLDEGRLDRAEKRARGAHKWISEHRDRSGRPYIEVLDNAGNLARLLADIALAKGDLEGAKQWRQQSESLLLGRRRGQLDRATVDTLVDAAWFARTTESLAEGRSRLAVLRSKLETSGLRGGVVVARVWAAQGAMALEAGDLGAAAEDLAAAVDVQRSEGLEVSLAASLAALASAELGLGRIDEARGHAREADSLARKHGEHGGASAMALARAEWAAGDASASVRSWKALDDHEERGLRETMLFASGDARRVILERQSPMIDIAATLAATGDLTAAEFGVDATLRRKGRLLDASASSLGTLDARSGATKSKLERIARLRSDVSKMSLSPPPALSREEIAATLADLQGQIAKIEGTLGDDVSWVARSKRLEQRTTWQQVQAALGEGEALVEYVNYRDYSPTSGLGEMWLGAYVIRHDRGPSFVKLSSSRAIADQVTVLRTALASRGDWEPSAGALHKLAYAPLESQLQGSASILVAPDGPLNLIPFGVLHSGKKILFDTQPLSYLSSGRDLAQRVPFNAHATSSLVVGDPAYDAAGSSSGSAAAAGAQRSSRMQGVRFTPLPGTRGESERVAKSLGVSAHLDAAATETVLKETRGPRVLHVATHGFFLEPEEEAARLGTRGLTYSSPSSTASAVKFGASENPLLRAGLAFAGANTGGSGADDGVLTALEASSLDLRGTQLVVLSACETGVGEVDAGEGVYGLRRAFQLASSETQVMSLWEVDDAATESLMVAFYMQLSKGKARADALRAAQAKLRKNPKYTHPYFWAAFILSGERGPLHD